MAAKSQAEVRIVQVEINDFNKRQRLGFAPLMLDSDNGRLTKAAVRDAKYDLGYVQEKRTPEWGDDFLHRLRHPTLVRPEWGQTKEAVKRGRKRRNARRRKVLALKVRAAVSPGVGTFDGVPVAKCAIPILQWCRTNGWGGRLVSGYRTPAYSESLCFRMCGRASCPGKCAGRSTNHAYFLPTRFAMDVSDYVKFRAVVAKCPVAPHVHNALPNDLVHFSPSGG